MLIEYLPSKHLQIKVGSHRHCLNDAMTIDDVPVKQSDISNELQLVREVATAMWSLPEGSEKLLFNSDCPEMRNGEDNEHTRAFYGAIDSYDNGRFAEICELSKLEDEPDTHETVTKTKTVTGVSIIGGKAVKWSKIEEYEETVFDEFPLEDEEGNPVMDEPKQAVFEGEPLFKKKPVLDEKGKQRTRPARMKNPDSSDPRPLIDVQEPVFEEVPVMAEPVQAIHKEPRIKKGKKVPEKVKRRLAELKAREIT